MDRIINDWTVASDRDDTRVTVYVDNREAKVMTGPGIIMEMDEGYTVNGRLSSVVVFVDRDGKRHGRFLEDEISGLKWEEI